MTRLYLKNNDIDDAWYFKSFREATGVDGTMAARNAKFIINKGFKLYEKAYGVKLKFDSFGYLDYVEFNSDSDLTMFLLMWK